jgi:hypothetical protein
MRSWDALPDVPLGPAGQVTEEFIRLRVRDYRGRVALSESTSLWPQLQPMAATPAGLVRLRCCAKAAAPAVPSTLCSSCWRWSSRSKIALVVGIYEMSERNTPRVGRVLAKYSLACLPEAHCYLRYDGIRIDVTRILAEAPAEPIVHFSYEEEITPPQVGDPPPGFYPSMANSATQCRGVRLRRDLADPRAIYRRAERVTAAGIFR